MLPSDLRNRCVISGIGVDICVKKEERRSSLQVQIEACRKAILDSKLNRKDIGAVFTGRAPSAYSVPQFSQRILNELKIAPKFSTEITIHGAGALATLKYATLAVANGFVDYALCSSGDVGTFWMDLVSVNSIGEADAQFEAPYSPLTASLYAQIARRYMYEFGISSEDFARVAVENRKWAIHHPYAQMREKGLITVEDVLNSRMIASPLHLLDCCPWFKGGIGVGMVVTSSENAERLGIEDPIYISGFGECTTHEWITERMGLFGITELGERANLTTTGAAVAAKDAYKMAGWTLADIDVVETSVPFSFAVLLMLEDLGFCGKGEGGKFVKEGGIDFEGGLPLNTHGGMLGFGQSSQSLYNLVEAIDQLCGRAKGKQVKGPNRALIHGHGGIMASHSVLLVSNKEGLK
jgi:acetyl-CoA acetyltransferase